MKLLRNEDAQHAKHSYDILRREPAARQACEDAVKEYIRTALQRCPTERVKIAELEPLRLTAWGENIRTAAKLDVTYEFLTQQPDVGIEFNWNDKAIVKLDKRIKLKFAHGLIMIVVRAEAELPEEDVHTLYMLGKIENHVENYKPNVYRTVKCEV